MADTTEEFDSRMTAVESILMGSTERVSDGQSADGLGCIGVPDRTALVYVTSFIHGVECRGGEGREGSGAFSSFVARYCESGASGGTEGAEGAEGAKANVVLRGDSECVVTWLK